MQVSGTGVHGPAFTLLGPVEAALGRHCVPLGPPQRRAVLIPLLLGAGRVCSTEQIIDAVWGPAPPDKAPAAVQAHISVLRRVLEPGREPRKPSGVIQSVGRGYLIGVQDFSVDVFLFRHRVAQAAKARAQGRADGAIETLRSALELWRGTALHDVPGPFAQLHRERLIEERLAAFEELVDLELTSGTGLVDHDLGELLSSHPHRERLHALNMRLLHHNGRRADALAAYSVARRALAEDLGLDPSPELQSLHRTILADDQVPAAPITVASTAGRLPAQQPLIGRDAELTGLTTLLADQVSCPPVVLLHGMPGAGKTALALRAAASFPGTRYLLTNSSSATDRAEVLTRIADDGRSLLILDGVTDASQIDLPLPADGRCTVLVTSGNRLRELPFVTRVEVRPLSETDSADLVKAIIGAPRAASSAAALDWLVRSCGGLPKIVLATAHHLASRPDWNLDEYVDNIVTLHDTDDFELVNTRIKPFFDAAYAQLSEQAAQVLRYAALYPFGTFSPYGVAAMLGRSVHDVDLLLDELVDHNLLDSTAPGSYRFHSLILQFAGGRGHALDPADARADARQRLAEYFMVRLRAAVSGRGGGREFTKGWLSGQREQLDLLLGDLPAGTPLVRDACALLAWLHDGRCTPVVVDQPA